MVVYPRPSLYPILTPAPGQLSTMPRPRGGDRLDDEMRELRSAGVDVLVCLQTVAERRELGLLDEPSAALRAGLEFHELPIADFGVPDRAEAEPLIGILVGQLNTGRHIAVHCQAGIGRSSLIAAALLIRLGIPAEQAWQRIATARGVAVPETEQQRQWPNRATNDRPR